MMEKPCAFIFFMNRTGRLFLGDNAFQYTSR